MPHATEHAPTAEHDARQMYRRFLSSWACDALRLRSQGLDRPTSRRGNGDPTGPAVARNVRRDQWFLSDYRTQRPTWSPLSKAA